MDKKPARKLICTALLLCYSYFAYPMDKNAARVQALPGLDILSSTDMASNFFIESCKVSWE